jgi:hypothetical protein
MDAVNELKTSYPRVPKPRAITKPTRAQQDLRRFARQQNIGLDQSRIIQADAAMNQAEANRQQRRRAAAAGTSTASAGFTLAKGAYRVGVDAYNTLVNTADLAADAMPTGPAPGPVPRTVPQPAPAPTIINNHYHRGEPAHQGVSRMIDNVVHDTTYSAAQALAGAAIGYMAPAGAEAVRRRLPARRPKRKPVMPIQPRPAEARGGHPDAPRPGSADGQLLAGADEPTRPPPTHGQIFGDRQPTKKFNVDLFMRKFDKLKKFQ